MAFLDGLEDEIAEVQAEAQTDIEISDEGETSDSGSDDFDVPSYLDTLSEIEGRSTESPDTETSTTAPTSMADRIKYLADGREYEATPEEAAKALSMYKGARRAFSDRAKLKRELEAIKKEAATNSEFRKQWEAVTKDARNATEVWEKLTGQRFQDYMQSELSRQRMLELATPEERKLLEYESKFQEINERVSKAEQSSKQREAEAERKVLQATAESMKSVLVPELEKYAEKLSVSNPQTANRLTKMIYRSTIDDLRELKRAGYSDDQIRSPSVLKKVLARNAQAIVREDKQRIDSAVQQEVEKKKSVAREQAQVAATKNTPKAANSEMKDILSLDPLKLFHRLKQG